MVSDDDAKDAVALGVLTRLARRAVAPASSADLERGFKLLAARASRSASRHVGARWSLAGLAVVALVLLGVQLSSSWRGRAREVPALSYRIEGGSVLAGGYLRNAGAAGIHLFFNEGSKVVLEPTARGRLRSVDKDGSRVVIDQGNAWFEVAHSKERRWFVDAGPFSVAVKGTAFSVSWDPASERFELRLRRGSVIVSGPMASGDIELGAGQRLLVNLRKAETTITEENDAEAASPSASAPPAASVPPPSAPIQQERRPSWSEQIASGHWDRVLEEVDRAGVPATLERASSTDLFALADAARYRRRTDLARAALLAHRRRFPASPRSLDATFLLGRVEESHDRSRALTWYEQYLENVSTGTYAAEAWGRRLVLTHDLKGCSAARPLILEYLRRFPKGSYAETARAMCRDL